MPIHLTPESNPVVQEGTLYVDSATGEFNVAGRTVPHIIPGVLYPAVSGNDLSGTALGGSYVYGTAHTDGRKYYYTDIKGSKPIKDPRIGGHFGSQRHKFKSLQLLEQETATHGSNVYSIDGREWIRAYGDWILFYNNGGTGIYTDGGSSNHGYLEITGYFSDVNMIGVTLTSLRGYVYAIDGASYSSEQTTFETSVNTPLGSRFVDYFSLANVVAGQTLGVHTISFRSHAVGDYFEVGGCELIAQDTSNRNNIQIPSQNVVSYGKKFNVSGTPHYNPFNNQTIGDNTSHGKNTVGWTTYDSTLDTATSLGLDAWVDSGNYYRPVNGGRVVKWVDSSGNIKTSVNMMPPSAKAIGSHSGNSGPHETTWTTTYQPVFSSGAIDHSLSEVAKTFNLREFGNGAANGGTGAYYADASMLSGNDSIAYCMDDGLTTLSSHKVEIAGSGGTNAFGSVFGYGDSSQYVTFLGTGFQFRGKTSSGDVRHDIAQNLPYGTHVFRQLATTGYPVDIDGVALGNHRPNNDNTDAAIWEISIYQPKRPPIPEDACVLADYMLMADFVPQTGRGVVSISKGVRRQNASRDIFYNSSITSLEQASTYAVTEQFGFDIAIQNGTPTFQLPYFGTGNIVHFRGNSGDRATEITYSINGNAVTDANFSGISRLSASSNGITFDADGTYGQNVGSQVHNFAGVKGGISLGSNIIKNSTTESSKYLGIDGIDIATPIHTSHHYQPFETPFLHELVGGDRNMEQTNLVVSPDGKTWDEVTRDTSYIGNVVVSAWNNLKNGNYGNANTDVVIWDIHRGDIHDTGITPTTNQLHRPFFCKKHFAIAYDRHICLEDGVYAIVYSNIMNSTTNTNQKVLVNQEIVEWGHGTGDWSHATLTPTIPLKRGDYVQVAGGYFGGNDELYGKFEIKKVS